MRLKGTGRERAQRDDAQLGTQGRGRQERDDRDRDRDRARDRDREGGREREREIRSVRVGEGWRTGRGS